MTMLTRSLTVLKLIFTILLGAFAPAKPIFSFYRLITNQLTTQNRYPCLHKYYVHHYNCKQPVVIVFVSTWVSSACCYCCSGQPFSLSRSYNRHQNKSILRQLTQPKLIFPRINSYILQMRWLKQLKYFYCVLEFSIFSLFVWLCPRQYMSHTMRMWIVTLRDSEMTQ